MRKKTWECKKIVLAMAVVGVMAEWIPGSGTGSMAYAAETEIAEGDAAEKMETAGSQAGGKAKSKMKALASKSESVMASSAAAGPGGIMISRAVVKPEGAIDGGSTEMTAEEKEMEQKIDAYFEDAIFVGDSIMLGFRNYAMKRPGTFLDKVQFLAAGSYSANNALWDLDNKDSVHPVYKGEPRYVWDSIAMMGGKKVFIMLGMNDLNVTGLDGSLEKYVELIGKIKESTPGVEIHIMSMTYILHGKEAGKLENNTIREYNNMLQDMAGKNGLGYVNVADALADGNGDLASEYCSDEFAHQNPEAYDVWVSVLRNYAKTQMN